MSSNSPEQSLRQAVENTGITKEQLRTLCGSEFGKQKFSELTESQKWTMIVMVDESVVGPYGYSLSRFK